MLTWLRTRVARVGHQLGERFARPRRLLAVAGDALPAKMPRRDLVLLTEGKEPWSVGMRCPCGCGDTIELALFEEADTRWKLRVDKRGRPTLYPSVWKRDGCKSHYFVFEGRIIWV
jgi:hypothetical protein